MTEPIRVEASDDYENLALAFQCIEIARLDAALRAGGIADAEVRAKICGDYFSAAGMFLDQGSFLPNEDTAVQYPRGKMHEDYGGGERSFFPQIVFARRPPVDPERGLEPVTALFIPSGLMSFEDVAQGNVEVVFDNPGRWEGPYFPE